MKSLISLLAFSLSFVAFAEEGREIYGTQRLQKQNYKSKKKCSLKSFSVATYDLQFLNMYEYVSASRQSMMASVIETTDPSCLKNYGVVQYIKGCIYSNRFHPINGGSELSYLNRDSRGQTIEFNHPDWEVDSLDTDPLYSSYDQPDANETNRFDWHKFAQIPLELKRTQKSLTHDRVTYYDSEGNDYLMNAETPQKQMFVTDIPSGSSYNPKAGLGFHDIETSSLEFKTCIYRTKNIPTKGDPKSFKVSARKGGPIKCFEWSDKSKYNAKKGVFERVKKNDPMCKNLK